MTFGHLCNVCLLFLLASAGLVLLFLFALAHFNP